MQKFSPAKWAEKDDISEQELNQCLEELGYQIRLKDSGEKGQWVWMPTQKGRTHCRRSFNPFKSQLLWDTEVFLEAHRLWGRKSGNHFFCQGCKVYLNGQPGFDAAPGIWKCQKCGQMNRLFQEHNETKERGGK